MVGRKDSVLRDDRRGVYAVSSGPPAPGGGAHAAKIFLQTAFEHVDTLARSVAELAKPDGSWRRAKAVFTGVFEMASEQIRVHYGNPQIPDCSATVLILQGGVAVMCHVGTTRGYLVRQGSIVRITHDHRVKPQGAPQAEATRLAVAASRPMSDQGLGQRGPLEVDGVTFKLRTGSRMMLVSEGVAKIVRGRDLLAVASAAENAREAAGNICKVAANRQIVADASAVVIDVK